MHISSNLYQTIFKHFYLGLCIFATIFMGGCSSLDNKPITDKIERPIISRLFNPYRADIMQGNFISKEQLESIRPGMNKDQVKQILGTPLVVDLFHANRWDYVFSYRNGQTQEVDLRRVSLIFDGVSLAKINADDVPTEQGFIDEIDAIKKNQRKVDNKVNLKAQDVNPAVNPVPAFPNPTSGAGIPPGGTRLDRE